jgi:predicted SAM-dependent methyltransferase
MIHGSIFDIQVPAASYDGIYNLGVMEHFDRQDIHQILLEFHRVLKPGGKIILFWPPKQGLSVNFLKLVHFVLNNVLKKNISLHPAEIVHIRSSKEAQQILQPAGFTLLEYSFGPADVFTHAIVVGQKNLEQ